MKDIEAVPHIPEADSFQIRESLQGVRCAIRAHRRLIIACVALTTGLVALYVSLWPPTFQARLLVAADSEKNTERIAFYQGWNVFRRDDLPDEITLMTTDPVLIEVVQRLNLRYEDVYHPFGSYVTHLWVHSWIGQTYRNLKHALIPERGGRYAPSEAQLARYEVLRDLHNGVNIQVVNLQQVGEVNIGALTVSGSNQRVAQIANAIAAVYLEQRRNRYVSEATQAYLSLRGERDKALAELAQLDDEAEQFRSHQGLFLYFEKDKAQIDEWVARQAAVTDLQAQITEHESTLEVIEQQLAVESQPIMSNRIFKDSANAARLAQLEAERAQARELYRPQSREVREIEDQIKNALSGFGADKSTVIVRNPQKVGESYEGLLAQKHAIESQLAGERAAYTIKKSEVETMRAVLDRIPANVQVNHQFERRQAALESNYSALNEKLAVAAVSMATARSAPSALRVVENASTPEQPVWPMTKLLLAAALGLGFAVGVIGAVTLDSFFGRVTRYRMAARRVDFPTCAVVARDPKFVEQIYRLKTADPQRLLSGL